MSSRSQALAVERIEQGLNMFPSSRRELEETHILTLNFAKVVSFVSDFDQAA